MVSFLLNGELCQIEEDKSLIKFLRNDKNLISVKNGCSEGACGACMILVNNKAIKACVLKGKNVAGKEVQTLEGLDNKLKEVFVYSFKKVGAVQCGFCIPGMIIIATALLKKTMNPTEEEVKKFTGSKYVKSNPYGIYKIIKKKRA